MPEGIPEDLVTIPLARPAESIEVSTFVLFLAATNPHTQPARSSSWTAVSWRTCPARPFEPHR
jgi:hypothetical protein